MFCGCDDVLEASATSFILIYGSMVVHSVTLIIRLGSEEVAEYVYIHASLYLDSLDSHSQITTVCHAEAHTGCFCFGIQIRKEMFISREHINI